MTFDKLIEAALAAPPGSIMFTKQTLNQERQDEVGFAEAEFEFVTINGQKPAEA